MKISKVRCGCNAKKISEVGCVRCAYSTFDLFKWGNQCGAVILHAHAYKEKSMRCVFSTCLYGEINAVRCVRCGSSTCLYGEGIGHIFYPTCILLWYVYTEIIGDNNYYRYFGSGNSTM